MYRFVDTLALGVYRFVDTGWRNFVKVMSARPVEGWVGVWTRKGEESAILALWAVLVGVLVVVWGLDSTFGWLW